MMEAYKYKTTAVKDMRLEKGNNTNNGLNRFDNPHKGTPYPHIDIRQQDTGIQDPHLKPTESGIIVEMSERTFLGNALGWLSFGKIVIHVIQLGRAIYKDLRDKTMENSAECAGGLTGALIGETVGSFLLPGIGPLVGSLVLGYLGMKYGRVAASYFQDYLRFILA